MDEKKRAAARRAQAKYNAENTTVYHIRLNKKSAADVIERLDAAPHKAEYIRRLIREDIARGG